ncbi:hypothetical protein KEJ35_08700, partial [Candidatus Bathyarchaeota archaeon]|nr:hypothetical protein [Candidatus Bathyarchaeota archaeon]
EYSAIYWGIPMNKHNMTVLIGGIFFGFGLAYSGMTKQEIVLSFLQLKDLGLIFVLGGAIIVTFFAVNVIPRFLRSPLLGGKFKPRRAPLSKNVITGAAIFGLGWGISGQCPGSLLDKQ